MTTSSVAEWDGSISRAQSFSGERRCLFTILCRCVYYKGVGLSRSFTVSHTPGPDEWAPYRENQYSLAVYTIEARGQFASLPFETWRL